MIFVYFFKNNKDLGIMVELIFLYVLFIAPILYLIPYKLTNPAERKHKFWLILLGLVAPYLIIYIYVLYQFIQMGGLFFDL